MGGGDVAGVVAEDEEAGAVFDSGDDGFVYVRGEGRTAEAAAAIALTVDGVFGDVVCAVNDDLALLGVVVEAGF